ncbi:hypothetical protein Acr_24g0012410 [Actinidia rufa]|uniref:Retrotransposon gag domain-containing protein n=1 Tax=Actinidia rufa TaxID=165716 RepID=A0A7J0GWE2_9ERIC|nr:hypothetical protein Acr_24g0012410 [Actinidia rufa]
MELRQVISTEIARAIIGVLISSPREPGYCPLLALGRGRILGISPRSLQNPIYTWKLSIARSSPSRHQQLRDTLQMAISPIMSPTYPRYLSILILQRISSCRNLSRPSASSPPGNRSHPMANSSQVPDLEGLHREVHVMAEQMRMRIMNENNGRLMQLLTAANPQPPAAPSVPDIERSRHSINQSFGGSFSQRQYQNERGVKKREESSPRRPYQGTDKSTSQKIRDLDARLDAINTGTNAPVTVDALIRQTEPPTGQVVVSKTIARNHRLFWRAQSTFCRQFHELQKSTEKNASHLFTVHQKETESLKDFVKRFNQAILKVEDPSDKVIIMAMMEGLRPGPLFDSLSKNVPETLSALQSKADKYIAAEELAEAKRRQRGKDDHKRKEPDTRRNDYRKETRYKRPDRDHKRSNNRRPRTPPRRLEFILPPLNAPVAQVLSEIKHEEFVKWPGKIKTDPQKRNRNKYCEFHGTTDTIPRTVSN